MRNTTYTYNNKQYELSNHLGNVLVTTSDLRKGTDINADGIADYYNAIVTTSNDYYAFGSLMPARQFNSTGYKFGFNGKIKDDEIYGIGNALSFEDRVHNARLGRFLSIDPLTKNFPWNSTYAFAETDVIRCPELEVAENGEPTTTETMTPAAPVLLEKIASWIEAALEKAALEAEAELAKVAESAVEPAVGIAFRTVGLTVGLVFLPLETGGPKSFSPLNQTKPEIKHSPYKPPVYTPDPEDDNKNTFKFITYSLYNSKKDKYYIGRSSGRGTANQIMMKRYYGHHMRAKGYETPTLVYSFTTEINGDFKTRRAGPVYWKCRIAVDTEIRISMAAGKSGNSVEGMRDATLNPETEYSSSDRTIRDRDNCVDPIR